MKTRRFHIGDVLSVTTGRILSDRHMDGLHDILKFMTGDKVFSHQIPRLIKECGSHLKDQYPQLDSPQMHFALGELIEMLETPSGEKESKMLILGWVSKLTSGGYGFKVEETLEVKPLQENVQSTRLKLRG